MGFLLLDDPKLSPINCLTNTFLQFVYVVSFNFNFLRKLFKKAIFRFQN